MKFFLSFSFFCALNILAAQCPYKLNISVLDWEGKTITLKWTCQPKPVNGQFDIFRTCLSFKKDDEIWVGSVGVNKRYEYADADIKLSGKFIYQYRLQLNNDKRCSTKSRTIGRVIGNDTTTNMTIKNIKSYSQRDIINIKPQRLITKANVYLPIEIEIKDLKFNLSTDIRYILICDEKVIETEAQEDINDFRLANIYIIENANITQKFRIALIQGNEILGMSPLIEIGE